MKSNEFVLKRHSIFLRLSSQVQARERRRGAQAPFPVHRPAEVGVGGWLELGTGWRRHLSQLGENLARHPDTARGLTQRVGGVGPTAGSAV